MSIFKHALLTLTIAAMTVGLSSITPSVHADEVKAAESKTAQTAKTEKTKDSCDDCVCQKKETAPVLNFTVKNIEDKDVNLADYQGKVILMVNVASKCGYTKQYKGLEELYKKYKDQDFVILGFPANNFGSQEPGSNEEIAEFCESKFGVTFPMFAKISVKGDDKAPLYQFLTEEKTNPEHAGEVKWNFEKFLIGKDGKVVGHYASKVAPESEELVGAIEKQIAAK